MVVLVASNKSIGVGISERLIYQRFFSEANIRFMNINDAKDSFG
ncbi:hypothetical protein LRHMDP2_2258 [Lacticaseibacillus rhamnosus LRHMDP2]|jgi:hypothetical protein|uniref:Uncharacterized protein n=1 Tax=Lacticaseibacillus rhamnosus LRHMDP3 TaxID=1203259 RepID=A0AB33XTK5_LACRH|nr:hypothetical protein LRHMDP2_2258 [Lacticaseibacillus rhamnosus LRHMDP2]EKS50257.1 hypothetical protein LRHMDP3_1786 [Lacticaseibacillus rhamnosus LRHMDP3]